MRLGMSWCNPVEPQKDAHNPSPDEIDNMYWKLTYA